MSKFWYFILIFFFHSAYADLSKTLMTQIKASAVPVKSVGITLAQVTPNGVLPVFEHQADKAFIPASVTKLIPAAAALKILGPTRRFSTEILTSSPVQAGLLKGDLYLKGGGDPAFVTETLWVLVNKFARAGISKVEGSILVDDTLFDDVRFDPSREESRVDRAYDAPVSAMSFNWNSVNVFIRPSPKVGQDAWASADPENELVVVENHVKTVAANKRTSIGVRRKSLGQGKEKIIVTGQIALGSEEKVYYKNVTHPSLWSGANLKSALRLRGIEVVGDVKRAKAPSNARLLAEVESRAVSHIVQDMMKFSNNYVAEMLTKHLAISKGASQGNMKSGLKVLQQFVEESGIKAEHFQLTNPSGLTRDNSFRAKDMVGFLAGLQNNFLVHPEIMASLPLSGLDGTLKKRIKNHPGKVRAKTGLLTGVVSLAGWVESPKGPLAFTFFYNGKSGQSSSAKALFDQMLETIIEN